MKFRGTPFFVLSCGHTFAKPIAITEPLAFVEPMGYH